MHAIYYTPLVGQWFETWRLFYEWIPSQTVLSLQWMWTWLKRVLAQILLASRVRLLNTNQHLWFKISWASTSSTSDWSVFWHTIHKWVAIFADCIQADIIFHDWMVARWNFWVICQSPQDCHLFLSPSRFQNCYYIIQSRVLSIDVSAGWWLLGQVELCKCSRTCSKSRIQYTSNQRASSSYISLYTISGHTGNYDKIFGNGSNPQIEFYPTQGWSLTILQPTRDYASQKAWLHQAMFDHLVSICSSTHGTKSIEQSATINPWLSLFVSLIYKEVMNFYILLWTEWFPGARLPLFSWQRLSFKPLKNWQNAKVWKALSSA